MKEREQQISLSFQLDKRIYDGTSNVLYKWGSLLYYLRALPIMFISVTRYNKALYKTQGMET